MCLIKRVEFFISKTTLKKYKDPSYLPRRSSVINAVQDCCPTEVCCHLFEWHLIGYEFLLSGNIDPHVARELDGRGGHSDMNLNENMNIC